MCTTHHPPLVPGGGHIRLRERGWGGPNSKEGTGQTLWYRTLGTVYNCICMWKTPGYWAGLINVTYPEMHVLHHFAGPDPHAIFRILISTSANHLFYSPYISSRNWQFCKWEDFWKFNCRDHKKGVGGKSNPKREKKLKLAADEVRHFKNWHISRINCKKRRRRQLRKGILAWEVKKLPIGVGSVLTLPLHSPPPPPPPQSARHLPHSGLLKKILSAQRKNHRYTKKHYYNSRL